MIAIALFLLTLNAAVSAYDQQTAFYANTGFVIRCVPQLSSDTTKPMQVDIIALADELNVDLWTENPHVSRSIDFRVFNQEQWDAIEQRLGVVCSKWIPAGLLKELSVDQGQAFDGLKSGEDLDFFKEFRPFDDLIEFVKNLADKYPQLARFVPSIGKSHEGRDISVIHITSSPSNAAVKKVIWINGGIHAREWISSHTAVFLINSLLTKYGKDATVTSILDSIEFVISPHINPDGYEHSRLHDRYWRKNRRDNGRGVYGVDLNRNFDVKWGHGGSSSSPRSDSYMGPSANSEPETQALALYVPKLNSTIGIDLHAYGQLLMRPWGNSMKDHPNEVVHKKLGDGMRDVIKQFSGSLYTSQKSAGLYPVTGGLDDWLTVQNMCGFTFELRDRGNYGFVLPKEQIIPTGQEIFEALKFMGKFVQDGNI